VIVKKIKLGDKMKMTNEQNNKYKLSDKIKNDPRNNSIKYNLSGKMKNMIRSKLTDKNKNTCK
jgi:hypothetical protein